MTSIVIMGIGIILVFFSFAHRNNRHLTNFLYLFMWGVYTFCNSGNPDLEIYRWTYHSHIYVTAIGFDLLMKLFANIGLPFFVFKGACGLFVLYFYKLTLKKYYKYENAVLALCILCPFTASISQIRNGMMAAYVLYAFSVFLFDERHRVWPYLVRILLISLLIHPVGIVYLVLILARKNFETMNKAKLLIAIFLVISVEIILTQNLVYNIARIFITNEKYLSWFDFASAFAAVNEETLNIKGKMVPVIEQLLGTSLLVYYMKNYKNVFCIYPRSINDSYVTTLSTDQLYIVKNSFYLLLFVLPFYQISPTYFRVFMNFIPMIYIVLFQVICRDKSKGTIPRDLSFWSLIIYGLFISFISELGYTSSMLNSFGLG